jgi:hypothetical protein
VLIGVGHERGVNTTWKAYLVNKDGSRVAGGELTITSVQARTTAATSTLNAGTVGKPDILVHLAPY